MSVTTAPPFDFPAIANRNPSTLIKVFALNFAKRILGLDMFSVVLQYSMSFFSSERLSESIILIGIKVAKGFSFSSCRTRAK